MVYGVKALRHIQISNVEGTPGTAEAATEIFYGTGNITYGDKVIHYPEQDRNSVSRNLGDDFVVGQLVEGSIEGALNFRHLLWLLCNSVRGNITPTQTDTASYPNAYTWTIDPAYTTPNTPDNTDGIDTFTLEFGDPIQNLETEFVFTRALTLVGVPNEPVMYTWDWTGRRLTESAKTLSLVAQAVQYAPSNLVKFYVDSSWNDLGFNQKTGMLRTWSWKLETQFTPRFGADGEFYFYALNEDKKNLELELTYYRDATSELEKDKYDARTTTYLRFEIEGATELDSGQGNVPRLTLDGAYRYTSWTEPDDEDGTTTETVTDQSVYDSTGGKEFTTLVLTDLAAFP